MTVHTKNTIHLPICTVHMQWALVLKGKKKKKGLKRKTRGE